MPLNHDIDILRIQLEYLKAFLERVLEDGKIAAAQQVVVDEIGQEVMNRTGLPFSPRIVKPAISLERAASLLAYLNEVLTNTVAGDYATRFSFLSSFLEGKAVELSGLPGIEAIYNRQAEIQTSLDRGEEPGTESLSALMIDELRRMHRPADLVEAEGPARVRRAAAELAEMAGSLYAERIHRIFGINTLHLTAGAAASPLAGGSPEGAGAGRAFAASSAAAARADDAGAGGAAPTVTSAGAPAVGLAALSRIPLSPELLAMQEAMRAAIARGEEPGIRVVEPGAAMMAALVQRMEQQAAAVAAGPSPFAAALRAEAEAEEARARAAVRAAVAAGPVMRGLAAGGIGGGFSPLASGPAVPAISEADAFPGVKLDEQPAAVSNFLRRVLSQFNMLRGNPTATGEVLGSRLSASWSAEFMRKPVNVRRIIAETTIGSCLPESFVNYLLENAAPRAAAAAAASAPAGSPAAGGASPTGAVNPRAREAEVERRLMMARAAEALGQGGRRTGGGADDDGPDLGALLTLAQLVGANRQEPGPAAALAAGMFGRAGALGAARDTDSSLAREFLDSVAATNETAILAGISGDDLINHLREHHIELYRSKSSSVQDEIVRLARLDYRHRLPSEFIDELWVNSASNAGPSAGAS